MSHHREKEQEHYSEDIPSSLVLRLEKNIIQNGKPYSSVWSLFIFFTEVLSKMNAVEYAATVIQNGTRLYPVKKMLYLLLELQSRIRSKKINPNLPCFLLIQTPQN